MAQQEIIHVSVLLRQTVDPLVNVHGNVFVDATLGGGGHTSYLLTARPDAKIYAFDRDQAMIEKASTRFREEIASGRLTLIHANYSDIKTELKKYSIACVDGLMADLGVSTFQLDQAERGFSFQRSGPLDMRMDPSEPFSAYDLVNEWTEQDLVKIFFEYGEEKFARKIARRIVSEREKNKFENTAQLAELIKFCVPREAQGKIHPATRVFQAIRIAVNGELEGLEKLLSEIPDILCAGGVASIISFHSLEDRLVKDRLKFLSADCVCPPEILTCARCHKPPGKLLQNKPIIPAEDEVKLNPRARSAKLRVFIKNESEK